MSTGSELPSEEDLDRAIATLTAVREALRAKRLTRPIAKPRARRASSSKEAANDTRPAPKPSDEELLEAAGLVPARAATRR